MSATNLVKYLNPNFYCFPPPDVKFWFREEDSIKEVSAHKFVLASASDVFNAEFFGPLNDKSDIIEIEDAPQEAFLVMIEYMYNKKPDFKDLELPFLGYLYYMGEKYNIKSLNLDIVASISSRTVTNHNVIKVAVLAEEVAYLKPFSEALYNAASNYVSSTIDATSNCTSVFDFFTAENEKHSNVIFKLMKAVKDKTCKNCKTHPCLDGKRLTIQNFTIGANVVLKSDKNCVRNLIQQHYNGDNSRFKARCNENDVETDFFYSNIYLYMCQ